jgi:hypothetical protein
VEAGGVDLEKLFHIAAGAFGYSADGWTLVQLLMQQEAKHIAVILQPTSSGPKVPLSLRNAG